MTIEELKNYRKLLFTIRYWKRELEDLKKGSYTRSPGLTGMPGTGELSDPTADRAMKEEKMANRIQRLVTEQEREAERIMEWIETLDDPMMKAIIHGRYIRGRSWTAVAMAVGGGNTSESVRKMHTRFLSALSGIKIVE